MKGAVLTLVLGVALALSTSPSAFANGLIYDSNGNVRLGANDDGSIDAITSDGTIGIGYNFTGQGGRTGYQDALTPGCLCEAWGVAANGLEGQVGDANGNINITVNLSSSGTNDNSSAGPTASFTSNTVLGTLPGLGVTQTFSQAALTPTGALFKDHVTIANLTGATATDVRFARAMDWDVPPTEFSESMTFVGDATTTDLINQSDDGFARALPLTDAFTNAGICGPHNADGTTGPCDHGALYDFKFGDLADGKSVSFDIFYGAGLTYADALALLTLVGPELYNIAQSNEAGCGAVGPTGGCLNNPNFVFAFKGVGGVVVPTGIVPEPATWAVLLIMALTGFWMVGRRRILA